MRLGLTMGRSGLTRLHPNPHHPPQTRAGGELQRVAIALCLGQPADIYLVDEPSAYLDSEQRIMASKVWQRLTGAL